MASVKNVLSRKDVLEATQGEKTVVLYFWAEWSEPCKSLNAVAEVLAAKFSIDVLKVEAEAVEDVAQDYKIEVVPSFVILKGAKEVDRVEGADPAALTQKLTALRAATSSPAAAPSSPLDRVKALVEKHAVLLVMKGSAEGPRCGFSRRVVQALQDLKVPFSTVDILQDEALRGAFKEFASWPTYPQLYVKGEFVGGCDIVEEMYASGDLAELFKEKLGQPAAEEPAKPADPFAVVKSLVESSPVMLFMKGSAETPRCGFSRRVVDLLNAEGIPFKTFDILQDQEVRENLKKFANWPTYPQLYAKGELVGGCDIVTELAAAGELKSTIEEMLHRT